ncbi:family 20 glycosylhydrolase [Ruania halotolerans]|uniref:family 20 glycosylhydrolase n=1 Tax=Ruania halotolerans TaxID=2897773 RepID=UPI001E48BB5F|nr:family 20 glycosylhydrolase [Ruania halotolerans]UFU07357.1 beta-N-acetylhexosaminidase [Ruania halotolerans]
MSQVAYAATSSFNVHGSIRVSLPLVPVPSEAMLTGGAPTVLSSATTLTAPLELGAHATAVLGVRAQTGRPQAEASSAVVLIDDERTGAGYALEASDGRVQITGGRDGLHRGLGTLAQLRDLELPGAPAGTVPAVRIADEPRFAHRGLMVDIARHFFAPRTLERVIDLMALYGLNVLHLHLTDDQGWRIETPSRPELTEISGHTEAGGGPGGFLTTADYTHLIDYAADRGIDVVPEIDMPGHSNAAMHAVGALTETGEPAAVDTGTDVGFSMLRLDNPATAPFLADVFADLAAITPGQYLHVGGDEVWKMGDEEYAGFIDLLTRTVAGTGKSPMLWGEAAVAGLPGDALIQLWDSTKDPAPIVAAAEQGARVVLSPGKRVYLDMQYHEGYRLGQHWAGYVETRDSYEWDPLEYAPALPAESVVGVEAALWTETIVTEDDLFTMLLPRLAAVAEVAWSAQQDRDFDNFAIRLRAHAPLWAARGYAFHPSPQVFGD